MARKTIDVVISAEGRDKGKRFRLTEMPATRGDQWAIRALLALAHADIDIPVEVAQAGWVGIAVVGLRALANAKYEEVQPLYDELLGCVEHLGITPGGGEFVRVLEEDDTEEIATRLQLRAEVFSLHAGFYVEGVLSRFRTMILNWLAERTPSSNTSTSAPGSEPSSPAASPPSVN